MFDVCVCYGPNDQELAKELTGALEAAGFSCTTPGHGHAVDPSRLGVPELDFGGAKLALVMVTRRWTAAGGLSSVLALAQRSGAGLVLAWWDEDAPSDFSGDRRPDENIFYACYLPRAERVASLVEHVRGKLAAA